MFWGGGALRSYKHLMNEHAEMSILTPNKLDVMEKLFVYTTRHSLQQSVVIKLLIRGVTKSFRQNKEVNRTTW